MVDFKFIDLWAVHQGDSDRQSGSPRWFFDEEHKANKVAKGRGWWGGTAPVSKHRGIVIDDNHCFILAKDFNDAPVEINPDLEDKTLKSALSKLSKDEVEAIENHFKEGK